MKAHRRNVVLGISVIAAIVIIILLLNYAMANASPGSNALFCGKLLCFG